MKAIQFEREEEKTFEDYRTEQTLRDIRQMITDALEPQMEGVTYRMDNLSFHTGGFSYIILAAIIWWVESQLGILAFFWRIF